MKKLTALILAAIMSLSLAACGEEPAAAPSSAIPESQQTAEVPADQVEDEQAKADEDYTILQGFMATHSENDALLREIPALTEQVKNGEAEESILSDTYKQIADSSADILKGLGETSWQTKYYDDKVASFTACVQALADLSLLTYTAGIENDDSKLAEMPALIEDYEAKLGAFLDLMGA